MGTRLDQKRHMIHAPLLPQLNASQLPAQGHSRSLRTSQLPVDTPATADTRGSLVQAGWAWCERQDYSTEQTDDCTIINVTFLQSLNAGRSVAQQHKLIQDCKWRDGGFMSFKKSVLHEPPPGIAGKLRLGLLFILITIQSEPSCKMRF